MANLVALLMVLTLGGEASARSVRRLSVVKSVVAHVRWRRRAGSLAVSMILIRQYASTALIKADA